MTVEFRVATAPQEMDAAIAVRMEVFVAEQGVPEELERDEYDADALHVVALVDGRIVGTGRLVVRVPGDGLIGRMAVLAPLRRQGLGSGILGLLEQRARERGLYRCRLHAQVAAEAFYHRHGYRAEGVTFLEAGLPHIMMSKLLLD